jgi:hypothetical protein
MLWELAVMVVAQTKPMVSLVVHHLPMLVPMLPTVALVD